MPRGPVGELTNKAQGVISKLREAILRLGWWLGLFVSGALLLLGGIVYATGHQRLDSVVLMAVGLGASLSWGLAWWLLQQGIVLPLRDLADMTETLAAKDSLALAGALAELGRGDLTVQLALQAQPVPLPVFPPLNRLTYILNQLVTNLQDCSREFNLVTSEPNQQLCCVGPDDYRMGRTCGQIVGDALKGQGQVVILVGFHIPPNTGRRRGFESILREKYPGIEVVGVGETQITPEVAYAQMQDFLHRYPRLGGVYITDGASPSGAARAVVEAGRAGQVTIVAHDLVEGTMDYVARGVITATIGQSPYTQGHDAVVHLFNHLVTGWRPETPRLTILPDVVTQENYRNYWQPGGEVVVTPQTAARLAKPIQASPRPLRIANCGSDDVYWKSVWAGAEAAAAECGVTQEMVLLLTGCSFSTWAVALEAMADKALAGEYDGVVMGFGIPESHLVISRLATAKVPVVIIGAEQPSGFRGLVTMLGEQSRRLVEVSHELRTPLSVLVGLSEMMLTPQQPDTPPLPEFYRRDLERIRASAQQLKWLISDVLDLASSQVGQLLLTKARLAVSDVIRAAASIGEEMAHAKGLRWQAQWPDDLPEVWGDRVRLQQAILNLVANACKFTAAGEVRLTARAVGEEVHVSVSDTGLGIPPEERETIFDEFRKSHRTEEGGFSGLGLGLTITRRLVQLHGGRIWVGSSGEVGQGSTFTFAVPALPAAELAGSRDSEAEHGQVVVLVSEKETNSPLERRLAETGWVVEKLQVFAAADQRCLEPQLTKALAKLPAAVVLDLAPDSEWGWSLMQTIRAHPSAWSVPVVFYSHLEVQAGGGALELDYLTKPVQSDVLGEVLGRYEVAEADRKTVLVVDDEPAMLDLHRRMVEAQSPKSQVLLAQNGEMALQSMRQKRPDLVLLDLMMPGLDGFGVLAAMQADETLRSIPVIVLTAQELTERDMARLNRGVAAVLNKGMFSAEEVATRITATLERSKRLGNDTQRMVRHAMAYIHEHYAEPTSRDAIARHVGVHENYLSRAFHEEVGVTPMVYLNRYRVRQAKAMLDQHQSITEVALAVGFSSSAHFSRVFNSDVGVSPSAYRRGDRA
jgi:signal transduction histidine kinase/AraC-like DNA-binding protein